MTWLKFTLWLAVLYTLYYGGLITWELLRTHRQPAGNDTNELTFAEETVPLQAVSVDERFTAAPEVSSVVASGGVKMEEIFRLAQEEAIEFIRPVSF